MQKKGAKRRTKRSRATPPVKTHHRRRRKARLNETAVIHQDIYSAEA